MAYKAYKLNYGKTEVGTIYVFVDGSSEFKYSDSFKTSNMKPIASFPNPNKTYHDSSVLSFLLNRIPSGEFKTHKFFKASDLINACKKIAHSPLELVG